MAKKRKAANALPKTIAGMKVPKALRRGKVGRLLASPVGQALIVGAVAQGGEALIGRETRPGGKTGAEAQAAEAKAAQAQAVVASFGEESSAAFVYALRQAARAFVSAMHEQQVAARAEAGRGRAPEPELEPAGGEEARLEKKAKGERPDRRSAH